MPLSRPVSSADLRIDNGSLPPAPSPNGHHADTSSGRVALKIGLERQCYVAGQQIRGVLEVHAKSKGLALGDIGIEFGGTEGAFAGFLITSLVKGTLGQCGSGFKAAGANAYEWCTIFASGIIQHAQTVSVQRFLGR